MSPEAIAIAAADINDERQTLDVTWGDGHASVYPLKYLRAECPCASCRTARQEAKSNPFRVFAAGEQAPIPVVVDVEPVGRYGIRFTWKDGHQAGIYTFQHLRELCPCDACKAARKPDATPYVHGIYIPK